MVEKVAMVGKVEAMVEEEALMADMEVVGVMEAVVATVVEGVVTEVMVVLVAMRLAMWQALRLVLKLAAMVEEEVMVAMGTVATVKVAGWAMEAVEAGGAGAAVVAEEVDKEVCSPCLSYLIAYINVQFDTTFLRPNSANF